MNRRDFIKMLAGIPFLAWVNPIETDTQILEGITECLEVSGSDLLEQTEPIIEETAEQVLAFDANDTLYIGGAFVDGMAAWDGEWKMIGSTGCSMADDSEYFEDAS